MYQHILHWKKRPAIYSLLITAGFLILISFLENSNSTYYFISAAILYILIILELFLASNHFYVFHRKNSKALYDFEKHKSIQYSHHALLPSLFFWGLVLFLYYNNQNSLYLFILGLVFILFYVLFENISAFYRHQLSLTKTTNYIYDVLSVVLTFILTDAILNFGESESLRIGVILFLLALNFYIQGLLLITRHIFTRSFVLILGALTLLWIWVGYLLNYFDASTLSIAFIGSIFYLAFAFYVSHHLDKSLDKETLIDFSIILLLAFSLIYLYGF